jgi:hypothetical protein
MITHNPKQAPRIKRKRQRAEHTKTSFVIRSEGAGRQVGAMSDATQRHRRLERRGDAQRGICLCLVGTAPFGFKYAADDSPHLDHRQEDRGVAD